MMSTVQHPVNTTAELLSTLADPTVQHVLVTADLHGVPAFKLRPGQYISGNNKNAALRFQAGNDGICLSTDNKVDSLKIQTDVDRRALLNDTSVSGLGRILLQNLEITGVVQILVNDQVRSGHVEAHNIDIEMADARAYAEHPKGYGVEVIQGAFTLWNQQADKAITITADLTGLATGRIGAPVKGSGIFVSGAGDTGGRLVARRLETNAVYSDGGIIPGTPDRITGGVFTVYGAFVDRVINHGPVVTYGANDMVLDNWGSVEQWIADAKVTSYGPSGIGFVNFGTIGLLQINAEIETFGQGARGFNVYTGTVRQAEFDRIITHADGAVGIQISKPVGSIKVRRGIETYGGTGQSLVKGVVTTLSAIALSVKPGGSAQRIEIAGGLLCHGPGITPLEIHGAIDTLSISGSTENTDGGFDQI
jgi:hypothetical protein